MKDWLLALRSLRRNRRRTSAAVLAVCTGFAGLFILSAYVRWIEVVQGANCVYLMHTGHVALYKRGGLERVSARPKQYGIPVEDQQRVAQILGRLPNVEMIGKYLATKGLVGNGCRSVPFLGVGVEPQIEKRVTGHPEVRRNAQGLDLTAEDVAWSRHAHIEGAIALSTGLARRLHKRPRQELPAQDVEIVMPDCQARDADAQIARDANVQLLVGAHTGGLSAADGEVVNVFEPVLSGFSDRAIVASLAQVQRLLDTDRVTYMAVYLHDGAHPAAAAADIEAKLGAAGLDLAAYPFDDARLNPHFAGVLQLFSSMMMFCAALLSAVVFLSIVNVMTMAVIERTREIGTFRALGYRQHHIVMHFLRESWLIATLGSALGLVLSLLLIWGVNALNIRYPAPGVAKSAQLAFMPQPELALWLVGAAVLLCSAATLLAAWRRARTRIADLLTSAAG